MGDAMPNTHSHTHCFLGWEFIQWSIHLLTNLTATANQWPWPTSQLTAKFIMFLQNLTNFKHITSLANVTRIRHGLWRGLTATVHGNYGSVTVDSQVSKKLKIFGPYRQSSPPFPQPNEKATLWHCFCSVKLSKGSQNLLKQSVPSKLAYQPDKESGSINSSVRDKLAVHLVWGILKLYNWFCKGFQPQKGNKSFWKGVTEKWY